VGFLSHPSLVRYLAPGQSIHYAGTLSMTDNQASDYHTNADGRLRSTRNVYIADASVFPALPAKPLTLTIMANAMRTADCVATALAACA
jgi:choline dehydrogenase-like flavoprotein